jgi:hypothetical protein
MVSLLRIYQPRLKSYLALALLGVAWWCLSLICEALVVVHYRALLARNRFNTFIVGISGKHPRGNLVGLPEKGTLEGGKMISPRSPNGRMIN